MYIANPSRYHKMQYRRCGKSGILFPALSLGLWHNFGLNSLEADSEKIIFSAFDAGICHFDLANNYGPPPGSAEETMGRILSRHLISYRDELLISTKAGHDMWAGPYGTWNSKKSLIASLDQSLSRLRLDYVDIYYSHRFDPKTPLEETMGALAQIVHQGKALYVGISKYPPEQTLKAIKILRDLQVPCIIHQERYNLFQTSPEKELHSVLRQEGLGMIAFCPLAQGLLTSRYFNGIPSDSRAASESVFLSSEQVQDKIEQSRKLNEIAQKRGQTLAQMALSWVLRDPVVCSAIIGVSRQTQLEENLCALDKLDFTELELQQINQIIQS